MLTEKHTPSSFQDIRPHWQRSVWDSLQVFENQRDAFAFLQLVLEGKTQQSIGIPNASFCAQWWVESRNSERLTGYRPLQLGFPIVHVRATDQEEMASVPLYLWAVKIEYTPGAASPWHLRPTGLPPVLNPVCRDSDVFSAMKPTLPSDLVSLDINRKEELENAIEQAAVLGLFSRLEQPETQPAWPVLAGINQLPDIPFTWKPLPGTQAVAAALSVKPVSIVQGMAGSGKSYLAAQLALRLLGNGKKVLWVSPRLLNLQSQYHQLEKAGLGSLCFLLQNDAGDRPVLLEKLRTRIQARSGDNPKGSQAPFEQVIRIWERLQKSYRSIREPLFGDESWANLVGIYLENPAKINVGEGKVVLGNFLFKLEYAFTHEEFYLLQKSLSTGQNLFRQIGTLNHVLEALDEGMYELMDEKEAGHYASYQVQHFVNQSIRLQQLFIKRINDYTDDLSQLWQSHAKSILDMCWRWQDGLRHGLTTFGGGFTSRDSIWEKLSATLPGNAARRQQQKQAQQEQLLKEYKAIRQAVSTTPDLGFLMPDIQTATELPQMEQTIEQAIAAVQKWRGEIQLLVSDELQRLNTGTVRENVKSAVGVKELETMLTQFLDTVNDAKVLQQPLKNQSLTLPMAHRYLEETIEQMESIQATMGDFPAFYAWKKYWLAQSPKAQKLIRALVRSKTGNWVESFESWYMHTILSQAYTPHMPESWDDFQSLEPLFAQLDEKMIPYLQQRWTDEGVQQLKAWRQDIGKEQKAFLEGKENRVQAHIPYITSVYPLWLAHAEEALQWFQSPAGLPYFDQVVIDDAHALLPEQVTKLAAMGHSAVICTRENLAYIPENVPKTILDTIFKVSPAQRNVYQPGNTILAPLPTPGSVRWVHVDGFYSATRRTNEEEIRQLIFQLNTIEQTPQRVYPRTAIIVLEKEQRNKLMEELASIRLHQPEAADMIAQLERNGLGVFTPDELSGEPFDVILLGCTYSQPEQIDKINSALSGIADLGRQWIVVTSLDGKSIDKIDTANTSYLQHLHQLVSNYDQYSRFLASSYSRGNASAQREGIEENFHAPELIEVVAAYMQQYLPKHTIQRGVVEGGLYIPIVISYSYSERKVALVVDGFWSSESDTHFYQELQHTRALVEAGYEVIPIWSVKWWRDPQLEARKLASVL